MKTFEYGSLLNLFVVAARWFLGLRAIKQYIYSSNTEKCPLDASPEGKRGRK
jgi:hypothetical protein